LGQPDEQMRARCLIDAERENVEIGQSGERFDGLPLPEDFEAVAVRERKGESKR
jgi:hypothetical protein